MDTLSTHGPPCAIIIPVCNEEACLGQVLDEIQPMAKHIGAVVAVGLNATTDRSGKIAQAADAIVGQTPEKGYGHGCTAAIQAVEAQGLHPQAYLFAAGDGACGAEEIGAIWTAYTDSNKPDLVIAERTWGTATTPGRKLHRTLPNLALGLWASLLGRHLFLDLGPLRIIRRDLFQQMDMAEMVWGWTIEAQVKAALLGAHIARVPVGERPRIAGEQKVSGRGIATSLHIGLEIARAGLRARRRAHQMLADAKTG